MIGSEPENVGAPASTASRQVVVKDGTAFRTISELAAELGIPQHILRYWETRFPQLRPLTRAGNRRYYRTEDVALVRRIHHLLADQGYTIRGVQKLLAEEKGGVTPSVVAAPGPDLRAVRDALAKALEEEDRD